MPELESAYQQAFDAAIAQAGIQVEIELREGVPVPQAYYRANQVLVPREQLADARAYLTSSSVGITNWAAVDDAAVSTFPAPDVELLELEDNPDAPLVPVLRGQADGLTIAPHYVVFGCGNVMGHPDKPPSPFRRGSVVPQLAGQVDLPEKCRIAIYDTGICAPGIHRELEDLYVFDEKDVDHVYDPPDSQNIGLEGAHGTFIAGVLEMGGIGVPFDPIPVLNDAGFADEGAVAAVLANHPDGIRIANLSFGCSVLDAQVGTLGLTTAVAALVAKGVVVVAAAGNTGSDALHYPAALPDVIAVGATDERDGSVVKADYSARGNWVDAWAPGTVTSAFVPGTMNLPGVDPVVYTEPWATWSGTSFAAPLVARKIAERVAAGPEETTSDAAAAVLREAADQLDGRPLFR